MRGGAQIAVVVGIRKHQRRGMRKGDCGGNQREPRSAKWMVVVEERKEERVSVSIWGVY